MLIINNKYDIFLKNATVLYCWYFINCAMICFYVVLSRCLTGVVTSIVFCWHETNRTANGSGTMPLDFEGLRECGLRRCLTSLVTSGMLLNIF